MRMVRKLLQLVALGVIFAVASAPHPVEAAAACSSWTECWDEPVCGGVIGCIDTQNPGCSYEAVCTDTDVCEPDQDEVTCMELEQT